MYNPIEITAVISLIKMIIYPPPSAPDRAGPCAGRRTRHSGGEMGGALRGARGAGEALEDGAAVGATPTCVVH